MRLNRAMVAFYRCDPLDDYPGDSPDDPFAPGYGGGGGYTEPPPPPPPPIILKITVDSLEKKFPCAVKYVIDVLRGIDKYKMMVQPFMTETSAPHLHWDAKPLDWNNNGLYQYGQAGILPGSFTGMSSVITLNSSLIVNGSEMLVAATAIHETYHAYIKYLVASGANISNNPNDMSFIKAHWDYITYKHNGDTNFDTHRLALDSQLDNFVTILREFGGKNLITFEYYYSLDDARKAMLVGMNNAGANATPNQAALIQQYYNAALARFGFTHNDINNFLLANVAAPANKRVLTICP